MKRTRDWAALGLLKSMATGLHGTARCRIAAQTDSEFSMVKRISLHVICMIRRPKTVAWHWKGIVREMRDSLNPKTPVKV